MYATGRSDRDSRRCATEADEAKVLVLIGWDDRTLRRMQRYLPLESFITTQRLT